MSGHLIIEGPGTDLYEVAVMLDKRKVFIIRYTKKWIFLEQKFESIFYVRIVF